jgi:hypothetical protein
MQSSSFHIIDRRSGPLARSEIFLSPSKGENAGNAGKVSRVFETCCGIEFEDNIPDPLPRRGQLVGLMYIFIHQPASHARLRPSCDGGIVYEIDLICGNLHVYALLPVASETGARSAMVGPASRSMFRKNWSIFPTLAVRQHEFFRKTDPARTLALEIPIAKSPDDSPIRGRRGGHSRMPTLRSF